MSSNDIVQIGNGRKICLYTISDECYGTGDKSEFVGNYCRCCHKRYLALHYQKNREVLLRRANARYIPNGRPRGRPTNAERIARAIQQAADPNNPV